MFVKLHRHSNIGCVKACSALARPYRSRKKKRTWNLPSTFFYSYSLNVTIFFLINYILPLIIFISGTLRIYHFNFSITYECIFFSDAIRKFIWGKVFHEEIVVTLLMPQYVFQMLVGVPFHFFAKCATFGAFGVRLQRGDVFKDYLVGFGKYNVLILR